jgi:hypothetical protein
MNNKKHEDTVFRIPVSTFEVKLTILSFEFYILRFTFCSKSYGEYQIGEV